MDFAPEIDADFVEHRHAGAIESRTAHIVDLDRRRGRGAVSNASGRFEGLARVAEDDGWGSLEDLPPFRTEVTEERARTIITRNESPDISFDRSINPYRGCEHGCVYCFARPTPRLYGPVAGLDFETQAVRQARRGAAARDASWPSGYQPKTIAMGTNTDPYQPIERTAADHAADPRSAGAKRTIPSASSPNRRW